MSLPSVATTGLTDSGFMTINMQNITSSAIQVIAQTLQSTSTCQFVEVNSGGGNTYLDQTHMANSIALAISGFYWAE